MDSDVIARTIKVILAHHSNVHSFCPKGEESWCQFNKGKPRYKPKQIALQVFALMAPMFDHLSDSIPLTRLHQEDTQNSNESLHSLIWKRSPKHMVASPGAVKTSTALAGIHKNVGNVDIISCAS